MENNLDIEEIWSKGSWTKQARNLIENLEELSIYSKKVLIIRHSQRHEPKLADENKYMELTSQGRKIARLFGMKLPKKKTIRLFHSPVNRCKETAEEIYEGFKESGGKSILKGECTAVFEIGINMNSFMAEAQKFRYDEYFYNYQKIFFRWVAGFYPPDEWSSLIQYSQNAAKVIWNELKLAPQNGIDIYVTHDWHLMTLRFGWFGLPPDDKWVGYLGGFAFTFEKEHILLLDYGRSKKVEIPYWWKLTI
jgi:broad specificity phosphatase PhoE